MAHPLLIGDTDPLRLYLEITGKSFSYHDILVDETLLLHLYGHNIKDGAKIIRTPTVFCTKSFLKKEGLDSKMEACLNLATSKAKEAVTKSYADVLIAGVIGPTLNYANAADCEDWSAAQWSELIIMLADFEVDCFILQGFTSLESLKNCVYLVTKLSDLPVAIFVDAKNLGSQREVESLQDVTLGLELELCGVSGSWQDTKLLEQFPKSVNTGFMLDVESSDFLEHSLSLGKIQTLTMLLAGNNLPRKAWQRCIYNTSRYWS